MVIKQTLRQLIDERKPAKIELYNGGQYVGLFMVGCDDLTEWLDRAVNPFAVLRIRDVLKVSLSAPLTGDELPAVMW